MARVINCVAILLLLSVCAEVAHAQTCAVTDSFALLYFYREIVYAGKEFVTWVDGTNCCTWAGVTCNSNGNVQYLLIADTDIVTPYPQGSPYLIGSGLTGLAALTNLTLINIPFNGDIPPSWGAGLPNLQVLNIDGCNVAGSLPQELCSLSNLNTFILKDNLLSGTVPSCLSSPTSTFPALTSFNISGNQFSGTVPGPIPASA